MKRMTSKKSTSHIGCYEVCVDGYRYLVYRSEGLWFARDYYLRNVVDCAPTKAELYRSMESIGVTA